MERAATHSLGAGGGTGWLESKIILSFCLQRVLLSFCGVWPNMPGLGEGQPQVATALCTMGVAMACLPG